MFLMFKRDSIRPAARSRQSGMTLVEIMVAMTIGIILLLALGSLFVNSTRVFKVNDEFSRMQENGAYALNTMGNDLRMAGFYGHIATNDLAIPVAITITNDCGANWATTFTQSLGTGTLAKMSSCIKAANFLSGSFILVLRGATGIEVQPADLNAGDLVCAVGSGRRHPVPG
jgi:type IV pilus assembly protein PilW